jgi:hypothetical protein
LPVAAARLSEGILEEEERLLRLIRRIISGNHHSPTDGRAERRAAR